MIAQFTKTLFRKKFKGVIRAVATGISSAGDSFIVVGTQNNELLVYDENLHLLQTLEFSSWVRCVCMGDLNNNGNLEIVAGSGDRKIHIFCYENEKYIEKCTYDFEHFVSSCTIADITETGTKNIVVGSWDNTLKLLEFEDEQILEIWTHHLEDSIHKVIIGDFNWNGHLDIGVLLKKKNAIIIEGLSGQILMEIPSENALLAGTTGILDGTGYPYFIIGGNNKKIQFYNYLGEFTHELELEDRITELNLSDIDGDGQKELLVGIGSYELTVFKLYGPELDNLEKKWNYRIHGVINTIITDDLNHNGKKEIIFGGYDQKLYIIEDNFYGELPFFQLNPQNYIIEENILLKPPEPPRYDSYATNYMIQRIMSKSQQKRINMEKLVFYATEDMLANLMKKY